MALVEVVVEVTRDPKGSAYVLGVPRPEELDELQPLPRGAPRAVAKRVAHQTSASRAVMHGSRPKRNGAGTSSETPAVSRDVRALALLAVGLLLCGCGSGSSASHDGRRLALEGLSLRVPAGWSTYARDFGAWSPEPMLWVANVTLPTEPSKDHPIPPYQVLSRLPPDGIVLRVSALRAEVSAEEECPSAFWLTAADVEGSQYEGKPAPHVGFGEVYSHSQGLCVAAQAWFGVDEPKEAMREQVNRVLDSVEVQPEPPPGSAPGWRTHRDEQARIELRYPPGWQVADGRLTPNLVEPVERMSVGTYELRPGGGRCPQAPVRALEDLGPTDALISLFEFSRFAPGILPARARHLRPYDGTLPETAGCLRKPFPEGFLYRVQGFTDHGRGFHLSVAIGDSATDATRHQVSEILDSLRIAEPLRHDTATRSE
jgi:hypothetical protein